MSKEENVMNSNELENDKIQENIRPSFLDDFVGQSKIKENLKIFIHASKVKNKSMDHILFYGPPGLGKTTLANIIAREMDCNIRSTSGPMITKTGDLASILTNLKEGDVLFIDEIHRLNIAVEEVLYSAMEDFRLDIIIGEGPAARMIKIDLPRFTLIGATTRLGMISSPLRGRFGIPIQLEFYEHDELAAIIKKDAEIMDISIDESGALSIAERARGTPRIAIRILKRVGDFAIYTSTKVVNKEIAESFMKKLGVDDIGLDHGDKKYLKFIIENYSGGPVGIETISAGISDDVGSIEDTIESYLIRIGFLEKTPRGRVATHKAFSHLGYQFSKTDTLL
jgi:Holliday junction DNA helicase RuvB